MSLLFLTAPIFPYTYRIAVVTRKDIIPYQKVLKGFKKIYIHHCDCHYLEDKSEKEIIALLKYKKPDLILAIGSSALEMLEDKIKNIPIVYCMVLNPHTILGEKDVGNITGISMNLSPETQILILKQIAPQVKRIGVVYNPSQTGYLILEAQKVCKRIGVNLIATSVNSQGKTINAVKELESKIDALWMIPDTTTITPVSVRYMLLFSFRNKIPLLGISDKYVKRGALVALSFDTEDIGRQTAELAFQVLRKKGDVEQIPFIFARAIKLFLNLKTAKAISLDIPPAILERADEIYR